MSDETVTKEMRPLPYVQCGMRLVCPDDGAVWWEVERIFSRASGMCAEMRSNDARRIEGVPCAWILADWSLYEAFEPAPALVLDDE